MTNRVDITFNVASISTITPEVFVDKLNFLISRNISPMVNVLPSGTTIDNVTNLYIMHSTGNKDNFNVSDFKVDTLGTLKPYAAFVNPAGLRISCTIPDELLPVSRFANKNIKVLLLDSDGDVNIIGLFVEM